MKASRTPSRPKPAASRWPKVLRNAGLRRTSPRLAVLGQLEAAHAPMTHGELVERLAGRGYDRVTIYRTLVTLAEVGILRRADLGGVWRFEVVQRTNAKGQHEGAHPHFVCEDCGEVSCLPELSVTLGSTKGSPRAVARNKVEIQLKGRCDSCS